MGGLLNALNIGKTSLLTNQKAIDITGNNISNVNTPGYSRESPVLSGYPSLDMNGFVVGQGVKIDQISRDHDILLAKQIQSKSASFGEADAQTTPLSNLEGIVGISDTSLGSQIDSFFGSWQDLASDPGSSTARAAVISAGQSLAQSFNTTASDLASARDGINQTLLAKIDTVNGQLQQVAQLNKDISTVESTGQKDVSARDQRDALLQQLSTTLGTTSLENQDGSVSVILPGGMSLVQGPQAMSLEGVTVNGDVQVKLTSGAATVDPGSDGLGGEFGGLLKLRDQVIPGVQDNIDKLAYTLATAVNTQHQAGTGLDGVTGKDFFTQPAAQSGAAASLAVALSDPSQVAAGTSSASGDNSNGLQIAAMGQQPLVDGQDTFSGYYAGIASQVGTSVQQNQLARNGNDDALTQLKNLRDSQSGVSIDEEMTNLMKYQKGFEASAKYLSTVNTMMDSIIGLVQ